MTGNQISEFDLQPEPRILVMLGEIELDQWQCLAEFIDNSVDSFLDSSRSGNPVQNPQIHLSLPTADSADAKITIRDNGRGMDASTLERAVRAGWTSNDPMHNLGMFGMGFNIATARLGNITTVWTTRLNDNEWCGLEIDFAKLIQQKHYRTPRLSRPKIDPYEHGTEIIVEKLKPDQRKWLSTSGNRSKLSREHFSVVYSAMLRSGGTPISFELFVNSTKVKARDYCIWGGEGNPQREVVTARHGIVSAYQPIDVQLPDRGFCLQCWQWVSSGEALCPACGEGDNVVTRSRRVRGWVGVQRYVHAYDYGIDFLRNGRKIEVASKDLFQWDNGAAQEPEYPIDDQRNRGRLVGEIHIDHCRVPYTKDRFNRNDPAWSEMLRIVRGEGPLRPDRASELGFGGNTAPLFKLFQAFRRNQPHTKVAGAYAKLLAVKDNDRAEAMAKRFHAGEAEYISDAKWWELVEEADRALLTGAGPTAPPAPNPLPGFLPGARPASPTPGGPLAPQPTPAPPAREPFPSLTQEYVDPLTGQRWNVKAFRVEATDPILAGEANPWLLKATARGDHEFFVNERHEVFRSATMTAIDALLSQLAWSAMDFLRGNAGQFTFGAVVSSLRGKYAGTTKLDPNSLASEAAAALTSIATSLSSNITAGDGRELFNELTPSEQEAVLSKMAARSLSDPQRAIDDGRFLSYASSEVILRFVQTHSDQFFDGRYWDTPLESLDYGHAAATEAARDQTIRYYASLVADAVWLAEQQPAELIAASRARLLRAALALDLLAPATSFAS
jgi:hypothetical protein